MLTPVDIAQLVADEGIGRTRVGNPQKRLRQAHQGDAFLGIEAELLEKGVQSAGLAPPRAVDQLAGKIRRFAMHFRNAGSLFESRFDAAVFRHPIGSAQLAAIGRGGGIAKRGGSSGSHGPAYALRPPVTIGNIAKPRTAGDGRPRRVSPGVPDRGAEGR